MRRLLYLLLSVVPLMSVAQAWDPVADNAAVVTSGKVRFTVLTPRMIRIQYSSKALFEDRATFAVVNRRLSVPHFTQREEGGYLYIDTDSLHLRYKIGTSLSATTVNTTNLRITFQMNGKEVLWYQGKDDAMNLLGTSRTLDGNIGDTHRVSLEKGLISRAGWAILDESPKTTRGDGSTTFAFDRSVDGIPWVAEPIDKSAIDWYFLGYGHQYKDALADYIKVAGRQPLPPYYMFGYWYSKYQAYSASQFQQIVKDMENNDIPHDVLMLDMDWHKSGWTGWTWNTTLIPNPSSLLSYMHNHQLRTALNLHPADGISSGDDGFSRMCSDLGLDKSTTNTIPWQLEDSTFYRTFFNNIMRVREKQGVDFWWLDWQQDKTSSYIKDLGQTFWLNHVYYWDMKLQRPDRRPVVFHRWGGMGAHRYPLGFSGDTFATYGTLQFESYFTATAANVCFGYWGHDGGGYLQPAECETDPELVLRWMQFCVFQPIFRTHGSSQSSCERRVWKMKNLDLQRQAFHLRYALVPYIYTCARQAYDTGLSICRPLYYEWPEENRAYSVETEYMFGPSILVSPISSPSAFDGRTEHSTWLPKGEWYNVCRAQMVQGDTTITERYALSEVPYFIRKGSIIPLQSVGKSLKENAERHILWITPGEEGQGSLYEDHGDNQAYEQGEYATTQFIQTTTEGNTTLHIAARQGNYEGMADLRTWQAVFLASDKPQEVRLNGQPLSDWTYDTVLRQLSVNLPAQSAAQAATVEVITNPTAIDVTTTQNSADVEYFTLDGRRSNASQRGVHIQRQGQTAKKIAR